MYIKLQIPQSDMLNIIAIFSGEPKKEQSSHCTDDIKEKSRSYRSEPAGFDIKLVNQ